MFEHLVFFHYIKFNHSTLNQLEHTDKSASTRTCKPRQFKLKATCRWGNALRTQHQASTNEQVAGWQSSAMSPVGQGLLHCQYMRKAWA